MGPLAIAAIGVGVAAVGAGIYALARHYSGRCRGEPIREQERTMSCAQATASMIIESRTGEHVEETQLRSESAGRGHPPGYDPVNGTHNTDLNTMLNDHGVSTGSWIENPSVDDYEAATADGRPAVLNVQDPTHFMVLDGVRREDDGSATMLVRDPAVRGRGGCREINTNSDEWAARGADAWLLPTT
jgi:hypothetical protein